MRYTHIAHTHNTAARTIPYTICPATVRACISPLSDRLPSTTLCTDTYAKLEKAIAGKVPPQRLRTNDVTLNAQVQQFLVRQGIIQKGWFIPKALITEMTRGQGGTVEAHVLEHAPGCTSDDVKVRAHAFFHPQSMEIVREGNVDFDQKSAESFVLFREFNKKSIILPYDMMPEFLNYVRT